MTKEELEKEAEEWVKNNNYPYSNCPNIEKKLKQAYLASAEPREKRIKDLEGQVTRAFEVLEGKRKRIEELTEQNTSLLTSVENLNKTVQELEAQIEKMKCCGNCRFSESDKLNGTFCHREGCFMVASAKCKLWDN